MRKKLALIGGIRRPSISALWLGAVAGGITPIILRRTRLGRPPLDPVAFAWTGSPQSFMDVTGTGSYLVGQSHDKIWRSDVWRLLHLPTTDDDELSYNYRPGSPWEPCGKMVKEDCALRVTSHSHCERHHFDYHHWTWEATDSAVVEDQGLSAASTPSFSRPSMGARFAGSWTASAVFNATRSGSVTRGFAGNFPLVRYQW